MPAPPIASSGFKRVTIAGNTCSAVTRFQQLLPFFWRVTDCPAIYFMTLTDGFFTPWAFFIDMPDGDVGMLLINSRSTWFVGRECRWSGNEMHCTELSDLFYGVYVDECTCCLHLAVFNVRKVFYSLRARNELEKRWDELPLPKCLAVSGRA